MKSVMNVLPINQVIQNSCTVNLDNLTKEAAIRVSMFITEHNISLRTSDHLVQLIKVLCPESETIKALTCNRTKATSIVTNLIGKYNYEDVLRRMAIQKFSLLIDESTDKGSTKHLAVVVRIVDNLSLKVRVLCLYNLSLMQRHKIFLMFQ